MPRIPLWKRIEPKLKALLGIENPNDVKQLWYDTATTGTTIVLELMPGSYSWRLRARNDASQTAYSIQQFEVLDDQGRSAAENIVELSNSNLPSGPDPRKTITVSNPLDDEE